MSHNGRRLITLILALVILVTGTLMLSVPASAHSPNSQIRFYSERYNCGSSGRDRCLIKSVRIVGTNQNNQSVTWNSGTLGGWVNSIVPSNQNGNWWWKPNAGAMIYVDYGNDSRGVITLRVVGEPYQTGEGYPSWWHIADKGSTICQSQFSNYTYAPW